MSVHLRNGNGDSIDAPTADDMERFLGGLDPEDREHGAAWLADEEGRGLEYEVGGNLCYSYQSHTRHLANVSREKVLVLWQLLERGELAQLEQEPWQPGTRPPMPPEELAAREEALAAAYLEMDREFCDLLGPERPLIPCRTPHCIRGSVAQSIFCRRHHFESIRKRPWPFED